MARRRVNTRFLIILTSVVLVAAIGAVVAHRFLSKEDPRVYLQRAQQYAAEKQVPDAVAAFYRAVMQDSENPEMWVSYGDFVYGLTWHDTELLSRARSAYQKALEIDPNYLPALQRMLNMLNEQSRVAGADAKLFSDMRELADKIRRIDPADTHAEASYHLSTIRAWMAGIETPRTDIDQSIDGLTNLIERDPANAELPLHIAMAKIHRGQEAARLNDERTASAQFAEAEKVMRDAAKAQEQNAAMQFRAYQVTLALARSQRSEQDRRKYIPQLREYLDKARANVKPEDADYPDIMLNAASFAAQDGKRDEADKMMEELMAKRPNDQAVRLAYAKYLRDIPARRMQAIELLDQPIVGQEQLSGWRAGQSKNLELRTIADLTDLRMDVYPTLQDEEQRRAMMEKIESGVDRITKEAGEVPGSLMLKGKLQLIKGQFVEAVQTLERAGSGTDQGATRGDIELKYHLARGYLATQQTGAAKNLLGEVLARQENFVPARLLMAELLVRENNLAEARPHVEFLEKLLPNEPQIVRLQLATLDPLKDKEKIQQAYGKLPEGDRAQMLVKAQAALAIRNFDEATRLLETVRKQNPGDEDAAEALLTIYLSRNQNDQAVATIDDALKNNPGSVKLQLLSKRVHGASPDELLAIQRKSAEQEADPLARELQLAELARREGKADQVLAHLRKAESIKPDDTRVLDVLFQHYIQSQQWSEASTYAEKLAKLNADQADGTLYQFRLSFAKGDYSAALTHAREYQRKMPEFAQSWVVHGQALQATGQYQEALQKYVEAVRKQSLNVEAIKGIIACYYELKQPAEAGKYIAQARAALPNDTSFQELEINHNLNHGDPLQAIPPLEQALKSNGDRPGNYATLGLAYVRAAQKTQGSDARAAQGYVQKARDIFSQGLKKWPDERVFYGYMADLAFATDAPQEAEKWLKDLAGREAWKDKPEPRLMLAEYYARVGNAADAERQLREALTLSGNSIPIQQRLASLLAAQGKVDDALAALSASAQDPRVQKQRVEILIGDNRFADAEKDLLASLERAPTSPDLLTMLGIALTAQRKFDEAEATLNKVLADDAKHPVALHQRALVRLQKPLRDVDGAIRDLQEVRELTPSDADVRIALSDAYRMKNQLPQAIAEMEAALKAVPLNRAARLQLVNMYSQSNPPRHSDVDRVLTEAQLNPQMAGDPVWWQQHAMHLAARGDATGAMTKIRRALELAPKDENLYKSYIDVLAQTGQYELLVSETDKLIAANGDKVGWWVYNARAVAKSRLGDKDAALAEFGTALNIAKDQGNDAAGETIIRLMARDIGVDQAIKRVQERAESGGEARWRIILAMLYNAKRDDETAVKILESLQQDMAKLSADQQLTVLRLMGNLYLTTTPPQPVKAQEAYLQLLDKVPNDWAALNNLACLLAESVSPPDPGRAKIYSQRAYDLMRNQGDYQPLIADTHGWVLTLNNEVDAGIDVLQRVVERSPFLEAHYHLAEAYLKKSYHEQALRQLELAQAIVKDADQKQQPVSPEVRRRIGEAEAKAREGVRAKSAQVQ